MVRRDRDLDLEDSTLGVRLEHGIYAVLLAVQIGALSLSLRQPKNA